MDAEGHHRRAWRGFDVSRPIGSFAEVVSEVLFEPARFFAALAAQREERVTAPLIFVGICLVISVLLSFLVAPLNPFASEDVPNPVFEFFLRDQGGSSVFMLGVLFFLLTVPIGVFLGTCLMSGIQHLSVRVFVRDQRGFWVTFLAVGYGVGAISLLAWIPVLNYLAGLYGIYVITMGLKELHYTTTIRALFAALVPPLIQLSLVIAISI